MRKTLIILGSLLMAILLVFGACAPAQTPPPFPSPPSETPAPAPALEPTPAPQLTSGEQTYAVTIVDHADKVSNAMYNLSDLMTNPLIGDDEWTLNVAAQLLIIRLLYDEAMEVDPPSSMANIHQKYVQAMSHYEVATYLIVQGIDELDADLINQATAEMNLGNQLIDEATELIEEFTTTHSQ